MNLIVYMMLNALACIQSAPNKTCNRIKIHDRWYDREVLWANLGRPFNLYAHKTTNIIFFSYTVPETYSDVDFQLAFIDLNTKEFQNIAGIRGGCSVAIDHSNDEIYLGGSDGIYKYNIMTKLADFYREAGKNIWALFFRRNLFYISYPDQRLHIEVDGKFALVKEFEGFEVDHFHVTGDNENIYFANKTGFYKYDNDKQRVIVINDVITVRQISEDNDGDLYVCTNLGVFIDLKHEGFKKVLDFKNIYSLTFDKDNNVIVSDEKRIVKLMQTLTGCPDSANSQW
ncbi:unnamed protein product, partial [Iphiclides podalirius]